MCRWRLRPSPRSRCSIPSCAQRERPSLDLVGILTSSAGLVGLTFGIIKAGQNGWGDALALVSLAGGLALLVGFVFWERHFSHPGEGRVNQPLVDLSLFQSPSFTWGTVLAGLGILTMFGGLFVLPQYFQGVLGQNPQGSGLRLLPLIGGIVVGAVLADRLAARIGVKITVALGLAILAGGMVLGSTTSMTTLDVFTGLWIALCGAGMGIALATAASAALNQLSAERSGVGAALLQAVQKLGGPFGVAILGSVLASVYKGQLNLAGLPAQAADAVKTSVFAGVAVAQQMKSEPLLNMVRSAFLAGMDRMLLICAGIAVISIILALVFLPGRVHAAQSAGPEQVQPASPGKFGG